MSSPGATSATWPGYWAIESQSSVLRGLLAVLITAALFLALAAPTTRAAQGGIAGGNPPPPGPKPQLLLFHGGSFLFEDPSFEPSTAARAIAAGFVPHYVMYPLENMPAAVLAARAEAKRLREKYGVKRVYAYGASAGGTLAALLSGNGLVAAAVAKAPISDLVSWEWPLTTYGPNYDERIGLNLSARYRLSPLRRPAMSPLLIYQGRSDQVVPPATNEAYAAKFPRVYFWSVPGGHTTDRERPWLISKAMHWLARTAARQARAAAHREAHP